MSTGELILAWAVLFIFTAAYGLLRQGKLSRQVVAVGLAAATILVAVGATFPTEPVSWGKVLMRWVVHFSLFTLAIRAFTRSPWRDSLGAGFFSSTCLTLLQILL
ncbi:MAG TPA: hypothetical protein GX008_07970 [Firmicutes bacterium]|nr:MAG: hypothetical protein AA931_09320 [Peptococcaceae bacterium 1109]HHT73635.1 hypothetical protein [Bacillota bacterium]